MGKNYRRADKQPAAFYRINADGKPTTYVPVEDMFLAEGGATVFLIGAGPSIRSAPVEEMNRSNIPVFGMNFATESHTGIHLDFWSAYDELDRYEKSMVFNPRVMKFLPHWRAANFIEGNRRGVEIPNCLFFDIEYRETGNLIDLSSQRLINTNDTVPMSIEICVRLGFRRICLIGADSRIKPTPLQVEYAKSLGVKFKGDLVEMKKPMAGQVYSCKLIDLAKEVTLRKHPSINPKEVDVFKTDEYGEVCGKLGAIAREEQSNQADKLEDLKPKTGPKQEFQTLANIDSHYWRACQRFRMARLTLAKIGVELLSGMNDSRWNMTLRQVDPAELIRQAAYSEPRPLDDLGLMLDVEIHNQKDWKEWKDENDE